MDTWYQYKVPDYFYQYLFLRKKVQKNEIQKCQIYEIVHNSNCSFVVLFLAFLENKKSNSATKICLSTIIVCIFCSLSQHLLGTFLKYFVILTLQQNISTLWNKMTCLAFSFESQNVPNEILFQSIKKLKYFDLQLQSPSLKIWKKS